MSDRRVRRQLALGAVQIFLLTTASLSLAAVARAQDAPEPAVLTLEMAADPMTFSAVGEVIRYTYALINNGGVALDDLTVTDSLVKDVLCESGPLEPGDSVVCVGSWAITQRALDVAEVTNIAQASGTYGGGGVVESEEADLTITALAPEPAVLTLEMAADPMTFSAVGEVIRYTYALINNGGVALDDLTVTDSLVKDVLCESGPLEPGDSVVCVGSWAITQRALDVAEVTNIAQASGTYGGGGVVESEEADLTITALAPEPAVLTLEMAADPMTFSAVGEVIGYVYLLTNTGGVALDAVFVIDTRVAGVLCPPGPVEPGESLACLGSYTITQADLDAGSVTNRAHASGTYGEEWVASDEADLTITALAPEPAVLTLEMAADAMTFSAVGEVIGYNYLLTNTGGVALGDLTVIPSLGPVTCPSGPLEPGGTLACAGSYAITQADLDAGSVTNRAQASGTYGGSEGVASEEASLTITAVATEPPALTLEMEAARRPSARSTSASNTTYLLTNTGGVVLDVVSVTPRAGGRGLPVGVPAARRGRRSAWATTTSPRPTSMRARSPTGPRPPARTARARGSPPSRSA